jgi:hypothetical protein
MLVAACTREPPRPVPTVPIASSATIAAPDAGAPAPTATVSPNAEFDGETRGCGDIFLFRITKDRKSVLVIEVDVKKLGLTPGGSRTFDLAAHDPHVRARIDVYPMPVVGELHCTDAGRPNPKPISYAASDGSLALILARPPTSKGTRTGSYVATMELTGARFIGDGTITIDVPRAKMDGVVVGWVPG